MHGSVDQWNEDSLDFSTTSTWIDIGDYKDVEVGM